MTDAPTENADARSRTHAGCGDLAPVAAGGMPASPALDAPSSEAVLRGALEQARETLRLVSIDRRAIGPIATRALNDCHMINEALTQPASLETPCFECGGTDFTGRICIPCNPELSDQPASLETGA